MSDLAIRAALTEMLGEISDIGTVHDFQRYENSAKAFRELFLVGDLIKGWYIARTAVSERSLVEGVNEEILTWDLRGYRSLVDDDQSEIIFAAQVDLVRAAIRADKTLKGTVITHEVDGRAGLQVERIHPVMFVGHLCHEAQCSLQTVRHIAVPEDPDEYDGFDHPIKVFVGQAPDVGQAHRDDYKDIQTGEAPPPLEDA